MDKIVDLLLSFSGPTPYFLLFGILLICGLGLPIPEDITLLAGGLAAYYGLTNLWVTIAVAYVGVILGDTIIFMLGAHVGRKLTKMWIFHKLLPDERLQGVSDKFHKWGNKVIFAARFMPGVRAPIFFSAGTFHVPFRVFIFFDGLAALLSVPAIIGAAYFFGDQVVWIVRRVEHSIVVVIGGVILFGVVKWYLQRRRLLRG